MSQEPKTDWRPSASLGAIKARAKLYQQVRDFFAQRGVLEVETPLMGRTNSPDIHIDPFLIEPQKFVLQTSPEFFMKRLLCAGSGSIYQICKAFRQEEAGHQHNPEFTMLEWYREGYTHLELIEEVQDLLRLTLGAPKASLLTYRDLFLEGLQLDPFSVDEPTLQEKVLSLNGPSALSFEGCLDYLFDSALDILDAHQLWVVTDFPVSGAALARVDSSGEFPVAKRFEFYYKGYELANGYYELADAQEQSKRLDNECALRATHQKSTILKDTKLIAALTHGLPECAGVALGLDRLLMIQLNTTSIEEVISFGLNHL